MSEGRKSCYAVYIVYGLASMGGKYTIGNLLIELSFAPYHATMAFHRHHT
jgi:hypothetical protein